MVSVQRHDIPDIPDQNVFPHFAELQKTKVDVTLKIEELVDDIENNS